MNRKIIVKTENLTKYFPVEKSFIERLFSRRRRYIRAVDGVDLEIYRGEVFSLVGESGSGKTTTGKLILRLIDPTRGRIWFNGKEITNLEEKDLKPIRREMQIIYQDPYSSLNPKHRIGEALREPLEIHTDMSRREMEEEAMEMLRKVGLTPPEKFMNRYPRDLSGGQRQRAAIARALILKPKFIVADEPVSMIDVSLRASILELLMKLKKELNLTLLFITHDLSIAYQISDRIGIMYLGRLVEYADWRKIFNNPLHPYTKALFEAIPKPLPGYRHELHLTGEIPSPINIPRGCRFHPRCPFKMDICEEIDPKMIEVEEGHYVACHLYP